MVKKRSLEEKSPVESERPFGVVMREFGVWVAATGYPAVVYSFATTGQPLPPVIDDWGEWWVVAVGQRSLLDAGWLLPTVLAIVLAFYGALIGQSVLEAESAEIYKTRRRLVQAGLALASTIIWFDLAALAAAVAHPDWWPRLPGFLLVSACIVLLGLGIGRYRTRTFMQELDLAREEWAGKQRLLSQISEGWNSRPPSVQVHGRIAAAALARPLLVVSANVVFMWLVLLAPIVVVTVEAGLRNGEFKVAAISTLVQFAAGYATVSLLVVSASAFVRTHSLGLKKMPKLYVNSVLFLIVGYFLFSRTGLSVSSGGPDWLAAALNFVGLVTFLAIIFSLFAPKAARTIYPLTLNSAAHEFRGNSELRSMQRLSVRITQLERSIPLKSKRPFQWFRPR